MDSFTFITSCVSAKGHDIEEMCDLPQCVDLSASEFFEGFASSIGDADEFARTYGYDDVAGMKSDWHISYHSSFYQGIPCAFVVHSGIEHVYISENDVHKVLSSGSSVSRSFTSVDLEQSIDQDPAWTSTETLAEKRQYLTGFVERHRQEMDNERILLGSLFCYRHSLSEIITDIDSNMLDYQPMPRHILIEPKLDGDAGYRPF